MHIDWRAVVILGAAAVVSAGVWIGVNAYRSAADQTPEVQTRQAAAQTPPQPAPGPVRRVANRVRTGAARAVARRVAASESMGVVPSVQTERIKGIFYDGAKLVDGELSNSQATREQNRQTPPPRMGQNFSLWARATAREYAMGAYDLLLGVLD